MDISHLSENLVQWLSNGYCYVSSVYNCPPEDADAKKQKKIRGFVEKNYIYSAEEAGAAELMAQTTSDREFILGMKACYELTLQRDRDIQEESTCTLTAFSAPVQAAFRALREDCVYTQIQLEGEYAAIYVDHYGNFVRKLILKDATGIPEKSYDELWFYRLQMLEDGFLLSGGAGSFDAEEEIPFAIRFSEASVEVSCFRAGASFSVFDIPYWQYLSQTAEDILRKRDLPEDAMNAEERELIPLLQEIVYLSTCVVSDLENPDLSLLRDWFSRYGHQALIKQTDRLLALPEDKRRKVIVKLEKALSDKKCEPMCRKLMEIIQSSQEMYPEKVNCYCGEAFLSSVRGQITKQMASLGYGGQYPHFVKNGEIRGLHIIDVFNESYFLWQEKHTVFYVSCQERFIGEQLSIQFFCGTHCLRKNETPGDIWSCGFRDGGRRMLRSVEFEIQPDREMDEESSHKLMQMVTIAGKLAELKKLTKEEQELRRGFSFPWVQLFLMVFLVAGGLFAAFMTLGFVVISAVVTAIFGGFAMIPGALLAVPWHKMFLLCMLLSGGTMGAITVAAKRR